VSAGHSKILIESTKASRYPPQYISTAESLLSYA
jgi:hypothetical protein